MYVRTTLPFEESSTIVNVSKVPHRSPFRYAGGKTWLVPKIRKWLCSRGFRVEEFIEPFAGGAIVGLSTVFDDLADRVTLVELDENVAAVWETAVSGSVQELIDSIRSFEVTEENVRAAMAETDLSTTRRAFITILRNRVNRGGILAPGAGLVKQGENNKGLLSRWYPETLCQRLAAIETVRDRITFINGDGLAVVEQNADEPSAAFLIDPPYPIAGRRLYTHNELDHERLFRIMATVQGEFLLIYDDTAEIRRLADKHGFKVAAIPMKTTHHDEKLELLISRDLRWLHD